MIFLIFIGTHFLMIVVALATHLTSLPGVYTGAAREATATAGEIGWVATWLGFA